MIKRFLLACACACVVGCTTFYVKTPEWEASVKSHWLKRNVGSFKISRNVDGSYSVDVKDYETDASEQFPVWTKEMWAGLGVIGRLAAATVNPTASGVPLTADAADGATIDQIVRANADAKATLAKAKAEAAAIKAAAKASAATNTCSDGSCATGSCTDGSCSAK